MNPVVDLDRVWDEPNMDAEWRAQLHGEVNSNAQVDSTVPRLS